jgi:hypothetical protein
LHLSDSSNGWRERCGFLWSWGSMVFSFVQQWLTRAMSVLGVFGVWSGSFLSLAMADEGFCCLL